MVAFKMRKRLPVFTEAKRVTGAYYYEYTCLTRCLDTQSNSRGIITLVGLSYNLLEWFFDSTY